jgi:hypothetical protein
MRSRRTTLAVPASNPRFLEKAPALAADEIFLDLEDAVAPDQKVQARHNIIEALNGVDWGDKTITVRVNGLDTHFMYRDVIEVIEQGGERARRSATAMAAFKQLRPEKPLVLCLSVRESIGILASEENERPLT